MQEHSDRQWVFWYMGSSELCQTGNAHFYFLALKHSQKTKGAWRCPVLSKEVGQSRPARSQWLPFACSEFSVSITLSVCWWAPTLACLPVKLVHGEPPSLIFTCVQYLMQINNRCLSWFDSKRRSILDVTCKDLEPEIAIAAAATLECCPCYTLLEALAFSLPPLKPVILFRTQEAWSRSSSGYTAE